jgi:hypothetical protein
MGNPGGYCPHDPERSLLYEVIAEQLETFLALQQPTYCQKEEVPGRSNDFSVNYSAHRATFRAPPVNFNRATTTPQLSL